MERGVVSAPHISGQVRQTSPAPIGKQALQTTFSLLASRMCLKYIKEPECQMNGGCMEELIQAIQRKKKAFRHEIQPLMTIVVLEVLSTSWV